MFTDVMISMENHVNQGRIRDLLIGGSNLQSGGWFVNFTWFFWKFSMKMK